MRQALVDNYFDLIISDHHMPSFSSMDALMVRNEMASTIPFIIFSISMPEHIQQEALLRGCSAVIEKDCIGLLADVIEVLTANTSLAHSM